MPKSTLGNDLKSWIANPQHADFTFILLPDNREVPAHKLFLSRCPYFATMFQNTPLHERTNKAGASLKLEKIRYEVLIEVASVRFSIRLAYITTSKYRLRLEQRNESVVAKFSGILVNSVVP